MSARYAQIPWLGLVVGVVLSLGAGAMIGHLSNRLKGPYFALSTIAFAEVLKIVASRWRGFTAGSEGVPVPFRPGFWTLGLGRVAWLYLILGLALLCYALQVSLARRLPAGRRAGGRGCRRGARDRHAPAQGAGHHGERGAHVGVRQPLGAI